MQLISKEIKRDQRGDTDNRECVFTIPEYHAKQENGESDVGQHDFSFR